MPKKNRQNDPDAELIEYLVVDARGEYIIEIDPAWKITFGAVNPGSNMGRADLHCLRVYEGEKLRGVFCDVKSVRDLSIPLARKVQRETGSASWTHDSAGNFERSERREVSTALVSDTSPEPGDIPF